MRRINHLMFWFEGVLAPRLSTMVEKLLERGGSCITAPDRLSLRNLEKQLTLGQVSPAGFCRAVSDLPDARISPGEIPAGLKGSLSIPPGLPPLLGELAERYPLSILTGFPREWRLSFHGNDLSKHVSERSIVYTRDHPAAFYAGLLSTLAERDVLHPGTTLLVDSAPERVHLTVRSGIDVAIFVDARRLRRDLTLWDLLDPLPSRFPGQD